MCNTINLDYSTTILHLLKSLFFGFIFLLKIIFKFCLKISCFFTYHNYWNLTHKSKKFIYLLRVSCCRHVCLIQIPSSSAKSFQWRWDMGFQLRKDVCLFWTTLLLGRCHFVHDFSISWLWNNYKTCHPASLPP